VGLFKDELFENWMHNIIHYTKAVKIKGELNYIEILTLSMWAVNIMYTKNKIGYKIRGYEDRYHVKHKSGLRSHDVYFTNGITPPEALERALVIVYEGMRKEKK